MKSKAKKYNESITIVSGLPRSGTSMMMKMLESGGLEIVTDHERKADEDNPKGYYEFEKAKKIHEDSSWLPLAVGKAFKLVSSLLTHLPDQYRYNVIFMRRNLDEVIASQNKMLERQGMSSAMEDVKLLQLYEKHLMQIESYLKKRKDISLTYISFNDCVKDPEGAVSYLCGQVDFELDSTKMLSVIDPNLYRNRTGVE